MSMCDTDMDMSAKLNSKQFNVSIPDIAPVPCHGVVRIHHVAKLNIRLSAIRFAMNSNRSDLDFLEKFGNITLGARIWQSPHQ